MRGLAGKIIKKYYIATDHKALKLETTTGDLILRTYGESCSQVWIDQLELPVMRGSAMVINVEVVDSGYIVKTDRGNLFLGLRNNSLRYRGGICWPGENFYEGIWGQNRSTEEWREVKEDF